MLSVWKHLNIFNIRWALWSLPEDMRDFLNVCIIRYQTSLNLPWFLACIAIRWWRPASRESLIPWWSGWCAHMFTCSVAMLTSCDPITWPLQEDTLAIRDTLYMTFPLTSMSIAKAAFHVTSAIHGMLCMMIKSELLTFPGDICDGEAVSVGSSSGTTGLPTQYSNQVNPTWFR